MFTIKHIDHVVLRARDAETLVRFYQEVLGCAMERQSAELGLIQLRAGACLIDILSPDGSLWQEDGSPPQLRGRNMDHFCLRVEPFDEAAIRAHLAAHGVSVADAGIRYGAEGFGPSLYFRDPEGNSIELKGPPQAG